MRGPLASVVLLLLGAGAARAEVRALKPKQPPWLGVSISDRDARFGGVAITDVYGETPAALCGLRAGDEIIGIDRADVRDTSELQLTVSARRVGERVTVRYVRPKHGVDGGALIGEDRRCKVKLAAKVTDPTELLDRRLVDRPVPALSLVKRGDGSAVDDRALRGDVVVLALFTTSCDACATTIGELAARLGETALYAISGDGDAAVDAYVQRLGVTAPVALDQGEFVLRYLQARDELTILVVDHEGVVRFAASGAGPDGTHLDGAAFCAERAERAREDR
jgi:hypothetical protein